MKTDNFVAAAALFLVIKYEFQFYGFSMGINYFKSKKIEKII